MGIEFDVTERSKGRMVSIIRARSTNPVWNMTIYVDNETQKVIYPVKIEPLMLSVTITLDSETMASCSFPPSIPEDHLDKFTAGLKSIHDVVRAARELIESEGSR